MIRILIVDDLPGLLEAVKCILEVNPGFLVDTAVSARQALKRLDVNRYDIIISDYYMPDMNGIEFLRAVRLKEPGIPFILQTGNGDETTAIQALENGADFFLEKGSEGPLQFLAFTQTINLLVSHKRIRESYEQEISRYRGLFDHADLGLIYIGEDGQIVDVNPAFLSMTGYSAEEIRDLTYHQLIPGKWESFNPESLRSQVTNRGYSDEYALEYIHRNGSVIPITIRAVSAGDHETLCGIWFIIRKRDPDRLL